MQEKTYYTAKEAEEILKTTYSGLRNQVNAGNVRSLIPPGKKQAVYLKIDVDKLAKNKSAENKYYKAKEAQEILGMNYNALRNQVIAGNIRSVTPPGRRQEEYLKEDVDGLKQETDAWYAFRSRINTLPVKFTKATLDDMPEAVALADAVFGGYNTIPVEKRIEWLGKNPDIEYLIKQEEQVVGYMSLIPLLPETIDDLLSQRRFAKDLTKDDILNYTPGVPVDIYGMAIGVRPGVNLIQKREWGMRLLLGAQDMFVDLGSKGISIRSIKAHSSKPDGIRLMRHLGFTETVAAVPGLRDFVIDIETSGLPFVLRYKEAFKAWKDAQHNNVT